MPRHAQRARAQGDILEDIALIENLEETKRTALEIADKVVQAKETGISLSQAREVRAPRPAALLVGSCVHFKTDIMWQVYRPVAARCALLYFLIDALNALDRVYHFSMANFVLALKKGMLRAHVQRTRAKNSLHCVLP